jgi:TolB-like protein
VAHRIVLGPVLVAALASRAPAAAAEPVFAVFPTQNRVGDVPAGAAVDEALRRELGRLGRLVDPGKTRDALRHLRLRNGERTPTTTLLQLGRELGAGWLVSATLHDADRRDVPSLTVSARVYSSDDGRLAWAGFRGESGNDRSRLLGLGAIGTVEALAPVVVRDLVESLPGSLATGSGAGSRGAPAAPTRLGTVAVVPFTGSTSFQATQNADTVTEAVRARLFADGARLVPPNELSEIIRHLQAGRWGGVTAEARSALVDTAAADTVLTGAVEAYDIAGSESEPEPQVTLALRLLDARTGRILWSGSEERRGWDGQRLFRRGRIHSRGALAARVAQDLTRRLYREGADSEARPRGPRP